MAFNFNILDEMMRARSLSRLQLSERFGMNPADLSRELNRTPEPRQGILSKLAKELSVPQFVFYMSEAPSYSELLPDFRSKGYPRSAKTRETVETIQIAEAIQRSAMELQLPRWSSPFRDLDGIPRNIESFSLTLRNHFGISLDDQIKSADVKSFYVLCRRKIENKGIFVLQMSFPSEDGSGFCLADSNHPVIVINTKNQSRGRRLFTLIHELAHVLIGKSGISDPFSRSTQLERRCNLFAGRFLAPALYVKSILKKAPPPSRPSLEDVAKTARQLKLSQEATVVRLEELNYFEVGTYARWKSEISKLGNPDFGDKGGGASGPPPQEKVKLARYGFLFAREFGEKLNTGDVTPLDIYRTSGLKPKYQKSYFDYANSLSDSELQKLELSDE